jgi:putative glutamine amidotransferase
LVEAKDAAHLRLATRYANAILRAGGLPVVLAPSGGPRDTELVLERVDGLLLSGGDDFDTDRLGLGPTHPEANPVPAAKQDFDINLARRALDANLPTLGICYGMQLMALAQGGSLHQHLPADRPQSGQHSGGIAHSVVLVSESKLAAALGVEPGPVVSRHHQALDRVPDDWLVSARAECGLVEAIEHRRHCFALGVQWHPELAPEGSPQDGLFRALVSAAGLNAARQQDPSPCHT